jgi:hypothetical protein
MKIALHCSDMFRRNLRCLQEVLHQNLKLTKTYVVKVIHILLQSIKTYYLLSNGLWFVQVEVFNRDGKLVSVSVIQVNCSRCLLVRPATRCNAGKTNCLRRRSPPLALCLFVCLFVCLVGWLDYITTFMKLVPTI